MRATLKKNRMPLFYTWTFICLCISIVFVGEAFSAPNFDTNILAADVSVSKIDLLPHARTVKDEEGKLSVIDVLAIPKIQADYKGEKTASFGFSDVTYWFETDLNNPNPTDIKRLLVFEPTWLDDVRVFLIRDEKVIQTYFGGDSLAFDQRTINHQKINIELSIPSGHSRLLVRTQTVDPYLVAMTLWERSTFHQEDSYEKLFLGLVYGVIFAMLLYNLVLSLSIKENIYGAYVTYIFFFILMHSTYNGHTFPLLWPDFPLWSNWAHSIFIYCFIGSGLFFAIEFLELKTKHHAAYKWAKGLGVVFLISFILTALVGGYGLHVSSSIIYVIIYAPFVLVLGVLSLISGNRSARFFLTAAIAGFVGSFITALAVVGLIPFTFASYHAVDFGMVIDAVLLSIALADRLRIARQETELAETKLLETTKNYASELESTVNQRTAELTLANATKDKFFSIIAHDLRGPIGNLSALFNEVIQEKNEFTDEALKMARITTKSTSNLLDQLLVWVRSQKGELNCNPESININRVLEDVEKLYATQALTKQIRLQFDCSKPVWAYADLLMVHTILRNLINNALKFTRANGTVRTTICENEDHFLFQVIDSGVGISEELQKTLFQLDTKPQSMIGTDYESGTGLGLILCAEFVEKNKGTIGVRSIVGEGSTFWFTLPKAEMT